MTQRLLGLLIGHGRKSHELFNLERVDKRKERKNNNWYVERKNTGYRRRRKCTWVFFRGKKEIEEFSARQFLSKNSILRHFLHLGKQYEEDVSGKERRKNKACPRKKNCGTCVNGIAIKKKKKEGNEIQYLFLPLFSFFNREGSHT